MSDEDSELNYAKIAGCLPMPSRLDHIMGKYRGAANLHVLDYLSWQLHPGWTITQAMGNPALAYCVAMSIAKPRHLFNSTVN